MEDVELHLRHAVEVAIDHVERHEVAAGIHHEPSPGESWLVVDGDRGDGEALRVRRDQLQECLDAAQDAERVAGLQARLGGGDGERIAFILAQGLDGEAVFGPFDDECGFGGVGGKGGIERHAGCRGKA